MIYRGSPTHKPIFTIKSWFAYSHFSSDDNLKHSVETSADYSLELKLVTDTLPLQPPLSLSSALGLRWSLTINPMLPSITCDLLAMRSLGSALGLLTINDVTCDLQAMRNFSRRSTENGGMCRSAPQTMTPLSLCPR